jgi:peptidyl-prolyl cis-trans isomerase D
MLDLIRKKQKTVFLKFVFWAIIAAFVGTIFLVWGKGSDQGGRDGTLAALVNGTKIDMETFQQVYVNLYRTYQNIYGERFTPALEKKLQIKRQALDQLIEEALLVQEGERLGVTVSQEQLVESIAAFPVFQTDGKFDREKYLRILARERMTPELFEKMQMERLITMETRKRLMEDVQVSDPDIEEAFRKQEEKVNISFVRLSPSLLENQVSIDEENLNAFFSEKKESFRVPEKANLEYILFDSAAYIPEVTESPEDLQKFYQRHLDRFDIQEKIRVAHIFFQVAQDADEKTRGNVFKKAQDVLEKNRKGEDFAALAKNFSDDKETAESGGELGEFFRGNLTPPLERAAFSLEAGEVSGIVETTFGYHILKVLEHTKASIKPLEEVKTEVEKGVREEKAKEIALDKAMDAYNINRKTGSLQTAAEANGLEIKVTGLFSRGESIPEIGNQSDLSNKAFTQDVGKLARPTVLGTKVILAAVKERQASHLPELAKVRPSVEKAYRRQKAEELAEETARTILKELSEGKDIADAAEQHNLKVQETGFFSRTGNPIIPKLGNSEAWFDRVFELSETQPILKEPVRSGDNILVVSLKNTQKADMTRLDEDTRANLRQSLQAQKERESFSQKLAELKEKAEISVGAILDDRE